MSAKAGSSRAESGCRLPPITQPTAADTGLLHKLEVLGSEEKDQIAGLEETFDNLSDEVLHHYNYCVAGCVPVKADTINHSIGLYSIILTYQELPEHWPETERAGPR